MNSKFILPKPKTANVLFPKWLMIVSAVASVVLYAAWVMTKPELELTMTTKPLYFPEAPLWHIGLYGAAFVMLSYSMVGFIGMRAHRILAAFHSGLDWMWRRYEKLGEEPEANGKE